MEPTAPRNGRTRRRRRPGVARFLTGLVMAAIATYVTIAVTYPITFGAMFGLCLLYILSAYLGVVGLVRMRAGDQERDPVGVGITPGKRSLRCLLLGHKEAFSPRTEAQPSGYRCGRCGAHGPGHLNVGQAWRCELPLADHVYDVAPTTADSPPHWRCRRCGKRRFTAPTSAGETFDATRTDLMWIKRYDD